MCKPYKRDLRAELAEEKTRFNQLLRENVQLVADAKRRSELHAEMIESRDVKIAQLESMLRPLLSSCGCDVGKPCGRCLAIRHAMTKKPTGKKVQAA